MIPRVCSKSSRGTFFYAVYFSCLTFIIGYLKIIIVKDSTNEKICDIISLPENDRLIDNQDLLMKNRKEFEMKRRRFLWLCMLFILPSLVYGQYLKWYTSTTYVKSDHSNPLYYVGTVSVRGTDWIGTGPWHYPTYAKITYSVPNLICTKYTDYAQVVYSQGQGDNIQRIKTITVDDSLNPINCKTRVYWDIGFRQTSGWGPTTIDFERSK